MSLNTPYEVYHRQPTQFTLENWQLLLPSYTVKPQGIIIILMKSHLCLNTEEEIIIKEKNRLLEQFFELSRAFVAQGIAKEIISPKDGTPQLSLEGALVFDVVAVVHHSLGLGIFRTNQGCKVLEHPIWGHAVYPGLLLS